MRKYRAKSRPCILSSLRNFNETRRCCCSSSEMVLPILKPRTWTNETRKYADHITLNILFILLTWLISAPMHSILLNDLQAQISSQSMKRVDASGVFEILNDHIIFNNDNKCAFYTWTYAVLTFDTSFSLHGKTWNMHNTKMMFIHKINPK